MAWEWSHTQEAYLDAESNFRSLPFEKQAVIFAEWEAMAPSPAGASAGDPFFNPELNLKRYGRELRRAYSLKRRGLFADTLDATWDRIAEMATCTNGGREAWLCPFGCGCHMVPFNRDATE